MLKFRPEKWRKITKTSFIAHWEMCANFTLWEHIDLDILLYCCPVKKISRRVRRVRKDYAAHLTFIHKWFRRNIHCFARMLPSGRQSTSVSVWSRRRRCLRSVTGACERGEYPLWEHTSIAPWRGARATSNKKCQVLGHSSRVRLLSDTHPGVFASLKPPGYRAVTPLASFSEWNF